MEQVNRAGLFEARAKTEELERVTDYIGSFLAENGFDRKSIAQTSIAVEEIFVNICRYARLPDTETVKIDVRMNGQDRAVIRFADSGAAFDPLSKEAPDTTLPPEERKAGGMGIYMMRQLVSCVDYRYEDGMNILTIIKQKPTEA